MRGSSITRAAVLALACAACDPAPVRHPANVVFVSLDTTRSDRLSAYGHPVDTTPNLRAFAAEGIAFETAYSASASTCSSHAALFTSLPPIESTVLRNGMKLPREHVTLAERLLSAGFQTAAIVSSFPLDTRFGFDQGFLYYDDQLPSAEASISTSEWEGRLVPQGFDRRANHTTDRALRWLRDERRPERPFFLFVHYFDPHLAYDPPEPYSTLFTRGLRPGARPIERFAALYDAEIAFTDAQLGRFLDALDEAGLADDTLVVVFGDHGEGLMERGFLGHGVDLFEPSVRVPLLVRWPAGLRGGRSVEEPVALVDLKPTVLELLGLPLDPGLSGTSLAPTLRGAADLDAERPIFLYRAPYRRRTMTSLLGTVWVAGEGFGIRVGRWKYLEMPGLGRRSLFDLETDPQERENLLAERPEQAAALAERLERWRREHRRDVAASTISEHERRALEALGYVE